MNPIQANVNRSYYGKLERGERQPSFGLILQVAKGLVVSAGDLVMRVEKSITRREHRRVP